MRRFDTVICWESQNLRENVIDLPVLRLMELTVGEDITGAETLEQISLFVRSATRD